MTQEIKLSKPKDVGPYNAMDGITFTMTSSNIEEAKENEMKNKPIDNIEFIAYYKNKKWRVVGMNWFINSGCTKRRPSWFALEREVKDEDGEYCRMDKVDVSAEEVELYTK